ncbi:MAG TPA: hypothetical protein VJT72_14605 [Pseudonocardiaceae bacterium]|nr:hypothetical protein [Pseudonocardiaceae bacterium]
MASRIRCGDAHQDNAAAALAAEMADLVLGIGVSAVFDSVIEQDIDRAKRVNGGDRASPDPPACGLGVWSAEHEHPILGPEVAPLPAVDVGRVDLGGLVADRTRRYAEETEDSLLIGVGAWNLGLAMLADDMPLGALDVAMQASETLEPLLAGGAAAHFCVTGV